MSAVKIDLHCHSFFSGDGVSSPEQLIEAARKDARLAVGSASVIAALRVSAAGNDVVVSSADADRLRKSHAALQDGRVVFVSVSPASAGPAAR